MEGAWEHIHHSRKFTLARITEKLENHRCGGQSLPMAFHLKPTCKEAQLSVNLLDVKHYIKANSLMASFAVGGIEHTACCLSPATGYGSLRKKL